MARASRARERPAGRDVQQGHREVSRGNVRRKVPTALRRIVRALEETVDERMLVEHPGESGAVRIVEDLADAVLQIRGARLQARLDSLADRRGDEAQQQVQQDETDRDLEDL